MAKLVGPALAHSNEPLDGDQALRQGVHGQGEAFEVPLAFGADEESHDPLTPRVARLVSVAGRIRYEVAALTPGGILARSRAGQQAPSRSERERVGVRVAA